MAPTTRQLGYGDVAPRRMSQKMRLLVQYAKYPKGLTNFEAGQHAGLPPTSSYWKRCGELLADGLIEVIRDKDTHKELTRKNPATGSRQRLCRITQNGVREIKDFERRNP